eukprot:scaffold2878_cov390-Prasinococcus_capsulatus_cf.AAC.3
MQRRRRWGRGGCGRFSQPRCLCPRQRQLQAGDDLRAERRRLAAHGRSAMKGWASSSATTQCSRARISTAGGWGGAACASAACSAPARAPGSG